MKTAILLSALALSAAAERRPLAPEDLRLWRKVSDACIRADGTRVVYVESLSGAVGSNLWVASTDGRERRQWTQGAWRDWSPRWSPDGERIAWLTDRGGRVELRVRRVEGGEEKTVASGADAEPLAFAWSAEGDRIAFTARPAAPAEAPRWVPPSILPRLVRPEPGAQVFVAPAASGPARQISRATGGCSGEPSWTLDSRSAIAVCDGAIVSIRVEDGSAKALTKDPGRYESPLVSPDGGRIAYLFTERKPQTYVTRKLWVMNADGSRARVLTGLLDRDATAPAWSAESRTVYFLADDRGSTHVYAARNDGTVRQITKGAERLEGFSLADNGRAASVRWSATEGGVVASFTVDSATQPVVLADPNGTLLAEREIGAVEPLEYESDGNRVQAWLVKPPRFEAGKKYPLLVDAADDPRRMYGVEFSLRDQILAAGGMVVLRANPRGAPGYGEQFGHLLRTRYPGDDFDDLMRGVDAAIAKGYVDPQRVSFAGGLLAAWALGHTDRLWKAVARRPIVDWAVDLDRAAPMGAMPWEDPEQYTKRSPLFASQNFRAPTLILAPAGDAQAEQLRRALQARKTEVEWVRWGGEEMVELEALRAWLTP